MIYNHIVRNAPLSTDDRQGYVGPAYRCHIDVSTDFSKDLVDQNLKRFGKDASLKDGKWQLLNVWRPLKTIRRDPLAVSDSNTIPYSDQHIVTHERKYTMDGEEKVIKVQSPFTRKNDGHQFYYMHEQQPHDVLIFKTADSDDTAVGAATHTSFTVPGTENLPTRESIEMRVLVTY
jgi:hypothetical protein